MKFQQSTILNKAGFCLILLFFGLMSASVTHAETYSFVTKWGSYGSGYGELVGPSDVVDSSDNIYVTDTGNNRIQKFDSNGNYLSQWEFCGDIALDSLGNVYVADEWNSRIQKFDSNGNYLTQWGSYGNGDGQFDRPWSVAVDSSDNIYVVDGQNFRIQKFDSNGNYLTQWGSYGAGEGQFLEMRNIVVDSLGNVYTTDTQNSRIQKFDSNGNYLIQWGSFGSGDGQFSSPVGIDVDSSDNIYVAEQINNRVQKFDSNGNYLTQWGSYGSGDGEFKYPTGVAVDSSGNVYVADTDNNRIQKFSLKEKITPVITWNNPADIISRTPLSSTQLNAVAKDPTTGSSVSGSFTYTVDGTPIDLGTVLSDGTHTLQASFKPDVDTDYNTATASVSINVLTPVQWTQQMVADVQNLVTSDVINKGQGNSLTVKLNNTIDELNAGNMEKAISDLNAFIKAINQDIKTGRISLSQGNSLIDDANSVINAIK
ncbi:MAG: 6-bladed beta-propeller [Alphaproteobacteria bacterium]|nr:MAG: 6-bladed beta-propeller [Alphaproteobacteria bacterium]